MLRTPAGSRPHGWAKRPVLSSVTTRKPHEASCRGHFVGARHTVCSERLPRAFLMAGRSVCCEALRTRLLNMSDSRTSFNNHFIKAAIAKSMANKAVPPTGMARSFLLSWSGAVGTRRSSPKGAGQVGRTGRTRRWERGLDQRRGPLFRKAMIAMVVGALWGNHEAMWQ